MITWVCPRSPDTRIRRGLDGSPGSDTARVKALAARSEAVPQELQDLDARIARLRDRVTIGDSEMTATKFRRQLHELFGGKVPLKRQGQELWYQIELRPEALLLRAACTDGSGGVLPIQAIPLGRIQHTEISDS